MENLSKIEQEKYEQAKNKVKSIKGFYTHLLVYVVINVMILAVSAQHKTLENFFTFSTFFTAISWGIGLLAHAFGVFGHNLIITLVFLKLSQVQNNGLVFGHFKGRPNHRDHSSSRH